MIISVPAGTGIRKDIKERLGRSPDKADAVVQAFWPNAVMDIPDSFEIKTY